MTLEEKILTEYYKIHENQPWWYTKELIKHDTGYYHFFVSESDDILDHDICDHWIDEGKVKEVGAIPVVKFGSFYIACVGNMGYEFRKEALISHGWEEIPKKYYKKEVEAA